MEAHLTLGGALFCLAAFVPASRYLEQGATLYHPRQHRSFTSLFATDIGVFCFAWAPHPLWHIGLSDRALKCSREAVRLAEELAHPFSMALSLDYAAIFHQFRREPDAAYQRAEAAIAVCTAHKFAYYLGWAMIIKGWALADRGDYEEGIVDIQKGLKTLRDTGARRSLPYYLSLLAEVYGNRGQTEEGLRIISEAFAEAQNLEERWWEAELHRLKGSLLLQQSAPDAKRAEACFRNAGDVARRQRSLSLELRAANSLYRLYRQQGREKDVRQMLARVYDQFTEGFDTPDVKETTDLLHSG
jgi:predicted ATPase